MNLFDDKQFTLRKRARLRELPPIPNTGWRVPDFPNLSAATVIGFDTETFDPELGIAGPGWARGRGHICGVSLSAADRHGNRGAWYFPVRHEIEPETNLEPRNAFGWLKEQLETNVPKVGANLLYDVGWLSEENIFVTGALHDVQFAEALIDEDAFVSLETLGRKYLQEGKATDTLYDWLRLAYPGTPSRDYRADIFRAPARLVGPYAERDALLPLGVLEKQLDIIRGESLWEVYRLECKLIPLLVRMRRAGITVDVNKAEQLKHMLAVETRGLYEKIKETYSFTLDSTSSRNLAKLFDHVGVKYPLGENGPSIQQEWLKGLEHPAGKLANDIREREKMIGTFLQSYVIDKNVNGKLYPQFHPLKGDENGTKVGRFASSDPNLQNIPARTVLGKTIRKVFTHDVNHLCWQKNDYSQIHYRLLAHFAVDDGDGSAERLRQRYINDPDTDYHLDVYRNVAPLLGWSLTDPAVIAVKRRPVKNVNFGLLYGQTEKALAYKAGFTAAQAKDFFKYYHQASPYVKATMKAIAQEVQTFGYITTILGRRVRFNEWQPSGYGKREAPLRYREALEYYGTNIERAYAYRGVNYKFQGSEPDLMKTGMINCLNSGVFDFTGVPRVTVHDELGFSVIDDSPRMQEAFKFIQQTMQDAVKLRIPVKVDVSRGASWGEAA